MASASRGAIESTFSSGNCLLSGIGTVSVVTNSLTPVSLIRSIAGPESKGCVVAT